MSSFDGNDFAYGALCASVLGPERMILKTELDVHIFNTKPETPCKRIKGQLPGFFPPMFCKESKLEGRLSHPPVTRPLLGADYINSKS